MSYKIQTKYTPSIEASIILSGETTDPKLAATIFNYMGSIVTLTK